MYSFTKKILHIISTFTFEYFERKKIGVNKIRLEFKVAFPLRIIAIEIWSMRVISISIEILQLELEVTLFN